MMIFRLALLALLGAILPAAATSLTLSTSTASTQESQPDTRTAADQAYAQAMQLFAQRTPDSIRQAIVKAQEALALYEHLGDAGKQAELLAGLGAASLTLGDKASAADYLRKALVLVRRLGNRADEAAVQVILGSAYESNHEFKSAQDTYLQALPLCRELKNSQGEVSVLMGLGRVSFATDEKQQALDYFGQALPLWRAIGDRRNQASTLYMLGILNDLLNQKQAAIPYYLQALPLYRNLGDRPWEARTLYNLADAYAAVGDDARAGAYYDQAIPALHAISDQPKEAMALVGRGLLYEERGEMKQSFADLTAALNLFRSLADRLMEATVLLRIGIVQYEAGELEKSLEFDRQALQLARALHEPGLEAAALAGISSVYVALGDDSRGLSYADQAFKLMPSADSGQLEPEALYHLGVSYQSLDQNEKALDCFAREVPLHRARGDRLGEARALYALAGAYDVQGQPKQALTFYQQALEIRQAVGDRRSKAQALNAVGFAYAALSQPETALGYYRQAVALYQAVHDQLGESQALFWTAKSEQAVGDLTSARTHVEASLAIIELRRANIASRELRTTYLATAQHAYEFYVDLLMQQHRLNPDKGYNAQALEAHERAKARGLLDLLSEAKVDLRQGVNPELLQREIHLRQLLEEKQTAEIRLLASGDGGEPARELQKELEALRTEYQQVEAQIRAGSPHYAALTQPQPLGVSAIQKQVLDPDTVLLEYAMGQQRSYLWAVTTSGLTSFELAGRGEIETLAVRLYRTIIGRRPSAPDDYQRTAWALSKILLGPVQDELGSKRLLIAGDGALQIVPFAALPSPSRDAGATEPYEPLIVRHEIVSVPSASTLALLRRDVAGRHSAPRNLAVFADPVFEREDGRVPGSVAPASSGTRGFVQSVPQDQVPPATPTGQIPDTVSLLGLERLPFTRQEAETILRLAPPQSRFAALDFAANRSTAISKDLSQYQIVHFATHGVVNDAHPELSGIVLSLFDDKGAPQDGFLRLNDLFNLKLNADLVVLSACRTALGKEVRGEGFIGLARGFMYAGAPRVVVSLWSVNDQATAEEMERFYQGMLGSRHLRPAAALRAAQIEMWKQEKWRAPFLWAAFVLQGEWK
ncbi:MAG: CHAT domain-containing protein [Acidobacteriia bacterium]|nr:CHAT domain-containing protein [Terriglobia bacterium]